MTTVTSSTSQLLPNGQDLDTARAEAARAYQLAAADEPDWSRATVWWGDERFDQRFVRSQRRQRYLHQRTHRHRHWLMSTQPVGIVTTAHGSWSMPEEDEDDEAAEDADD